MHAAARCARRLALGLALALVPTAADAVPVVFGDGSFDDGDWTTTLLLSGVGGTASASQTASGGNPDAFREISITLNVPDVTNPAQVNVVSLRPSAVYDPATQGAITSIDYAEDAILLVGSGSGHATTLAFVQAGITYAALAARVFTPETVWTAKSIPGLTASDFFAISGGTAPPDFSASGAPLTFGFWRATSSPAGSSSGGTRVGGIDNWSVTVNPVAVPEPASAALVAVAVALGLGVAAASRAARARTPQRARRPGRR